MSRLNSKIAESTEVLWSRIQAEAKRLGFQAFGVTNTELGEHVERYQRWISEGNHGDLEYMHAHGSKRWKPDELVEGTLRVISLRMDYLSEDLSEAQKQLSTPGAAYVSRYALGRDYHKLLRNRLKHLIRFIREQSETELNFRAFVDSAPVLERALAQRAGLGWFGKNTMIIHRKAGSWFFLGEIYTNLELPLSQSYDEDHCGRCTKCLDLCPTNAFNGPYSLDARKCISYLTIENKGPIPLEYRQQMGSRVFGCDDCQLVCPWNRFAEHSDESDFSPRSELDTASLTELFMWTETEFLAKTEGSAIRRTGHIGWLRNLAVALGNAPTSDAILDALNARKDHPSELVREHVEWAIKQHMQIVRLT